MINENLRYLPYSSRRYKANSDGKIFHSDGTPIAIDNGLVRLDWIDGSRLYWAGTVILAAFGKLELPDHLWSEVEPMVVDGDASNLSINNLLYRFRGGRIEVETHPGFYYVPFYSKYGINAEGVLINIETGKERVWSILPPSEKRAWTGGYAYAKVPPNPDGSTSLFRHRALCLVFRSYPPSVMKMVVNHRNGIPGDDRLDNIEWATYTENLIHARESGLMPGSLASVLVMDLKTEKVMRFTSISSCQKWLDMNGYKVTATNRLDKVRSGKLYEDMLLFKRDDGSPWPDIDLSNEKINPSGYGCNVIAKNVFTGLEVVFRGMKNGANQLGVSVAALRSHLHNGSKTPVSGWMFKYLVSKEPWPIFDEYHLKIFEKYGEHPKNGVFAVNVETGEELFFTSAREAAEFFETTVPCVSTQANRKGCLKGYRLRYHYFPDNKSPIAE